MEILVRAFPIPESRVADVQAFADELLKRRKRDTDALFRRRGVVSESWELQRSPAGTVLVLITWCDDAASWRGAVSASREPFQVWFADALARLCDAGAAAAMRGGAAETVFEWRDARPRDAAPLKKPAPRKAPKKAARR
jgi:hypothetical protein